MGLLVAFIVSAVVSAVGSAVNYEQQRKAASRAEDEAKRAAEQAREKARDEADAYAENARRLIARQKANYAAAGFATDQEESTPLTVLAESTKTANEEYRRIIKYGAWDAAALESEAAGYSDLQDSLQVSSVLSASGTLLKGVSKGYSAYKTAA